MRELATGATKYAVGGVLAHGIRLVTLPIYLRFLSAGEYGIQAIALLNEQVLLIVAGYAMTNALGRHLYGERADPDRHGVVVGTAVAVMTALGLGAGTLWQLAAEWIATVALDGSTASTMVVRLIGISFFFALFFDLALTLARLRLEIARYSVLNIAKYLLAAALSVAFLLSSLGVVGLILGWTIASVVTGTAAVAWLARTYRLRVDRAVARLLASYGGPLVPAALLTLALSGTDRYVLKVFSGLGPVGVYATAYLLASACNFLLITPFRQAWPAVMWRMRERPDEAELHRSLLRYYVALQLVALAGITALAETAMRIVSSGAPEFTSAALAVPAIYTGYILFGAYEILSAGYFFVGRTTFYTATVAASAATNVAANILFVPSLGIWGAATAFTVSALVYATLSGVFGLRYFDPRHDWVRIAVGSILGLAAIAVHAAAAAAGAPVVAGLSLLILPVLLAGAGLVDPAEVVSLATRTLAMLRRGA